MSRTFDGVDDQIRLSTGALATLDGGPITIAAIVRARSTVGATVYVGTSPTNIRYSAELFGGNWFVSNNGGVALMFPVRNDEWVLIAHTKADGSAVPREHEYRYLTSTWAHADTAAAVPDGGAPGVGGSVVLGRWETDFLQGELVAAAVWDRALTDGELEDLVSSLPAWEDAAPLALWSLGQASVDDPVLDLAGGGADQTAIVGTSVSADEPPGWSYTGSVDGVLAATATAMVVSAAGGLRNNGTLAAEAGAMAIDLQSAAPAPTGPVVPYRRTGSVVLRRDDQVPYRRADTLAYRR